MGRSLAQPTLMGVIEVGLIRLSSNHFDAGKQK
jgi:hypothetical protein